MMPVICDSVEAIETARHRFDGETREMLDAGIRMDPTSYPVPNHFYLAYHGLDDRALMERAAALSDGPRANRIEYASPPARDRIRVGIASKLFKAHTIGQLNRGLISRINRKEFEVVVVMIGGLTDSISTEIARYADQVINVMPPVPAAMKALADAQFDILFYPEIGMDPLAYTLAHSRLAPVQAMTWGHPETSGLRTIDYFLSTNDLDPPGNDKYYTERLHRLPCLGTWYERPVPPTNARREEFGLPTSGILFGCPQSLFKFHPDFDSVLKRILEEVPGSYLVLLEGTKPHWRELLQARFQRTLGLLAERVVWVARCPRDAFLRLNACCDIMLDPLHFGGGNTTYEALSLGKPVVTWPSQFLRGRLSLAMYRQMGYLEMVTDSAEAFGTMAVRLARDAEFRNHASMTIREKSAVLFRDDEAVRGMEQFFREAAGRQV
jgi:predicted O-linked N-acetylglucosamine transferase (SPINDLY family)